MILSLFCGAGGLDSGFEAAGFEVALAFDLRTDSIASYNLNRPGKVTGHCENVAELTLERLDELYGGTFRPEGIIGGPPCQSFSRANTVYLDADPRHALPIAYASLLKKLNDRHPVKFFVMENVTGLQSGRHKHRLRAIRKAFKKAGFSLSQAVLRASDYGTPQIRERLFLIGLNERLYGKTRWIKPAKQRAEPGTLTVRSAIGTLPQPTFYRRGLAPSDIAHHVNHWCMQPKSRKFFTPGALVAGDSRNRSFKTLAWDKPSLTVAYGHREVHVHPSGTRRLSVYEAMLLQGFDPNYVLTGSLSSQIVQISEAVPPPMAQAVASSVLDLVLRLDCGQDQAEAA